MKRWECPHCDYIFTKIDGIVPFRSLGAARAVFACPSCNTELILAKWPFRIFSVITVVDMVAMISLILGQFLDRIDIWPWSVGVLAVGLPISIISTRRMKPVCVHPPLDSACRESKTPSEFALTDKHLFKTGATGVIGIAALFVMAFVTVFLLITLYLASHANATGENSEALSVRTNIGMAMAIVLDSVSFLAPGIAVKILRRKNDTPAGLLGALTLGIMTKYGMMAGPAVFCLSAITFGASHGYMPSYIWINLLPVGVFYVVLIISFPTRKRIERKLSELSTRA